MALLGSGGLGSGTPFSLKGLYDHQLRVFLDGVPLDSGGHPLGIASGVTIGMGTVSTSTA